MEKQHDNGYFDKYDEFVIKYYSLISILTSIFFSLIYIVFVKNFSLVMLNFSFIMIYIIFWYTGIRFKKWYFVYIITFINMFHIFVYTYFIFGFAIKIHNYFLMYPMVMLIIRDAKIDITKTIIALISLVLYIAREIIEDKLSYLYPIPILPTRIINIFVITSLMFGLFFLLYSHITRLNSIKKELYHQSITDQLTGLYNRRYMFELYNNDKQYIDDKICIIIIDIDDFKEINDIHGHFNGDKVIKAVANSMIETVGYDGVVARIGGEEFCVILTNSNKHSYTYLAEKIRSSIAFTKISIDDSKTISCTVSIGIACQHDYNYSFNKLFVSADKAMYLAKNNGKNRVEQFSS